MKCGHILTIAALVAMPSAGIAQDRKVDPSLVDGVAACLDIRDDTQRLACSDAAARKLVDAVRRKDVVLVDREEVKSTRRSLFGFQLPRIGLFGRGGPDKPEDEITQLEAKVTRVVDLGYGKYGLTVDGGARWNTTEAWSGGNPPSVGTMLTIKRGALGSYMVRTPKSGAVRAMRVG
ncbi:hypothetical protein ASE86_06350 [Sphingomonas sp. Leaf33]|uniref:hypothetical protein n=1 Tax=Sphingomonas sp. Leaf33 TaxID=1736215 RepID=UPI0006F8549A|nr:hypothetical protein [Sphingomonas sp. Leaf33]KQN25820.1 hypothetical protein ASE86_06350 [Sphingomonas sp. Leaf33]